MAGPEDKLRQLGQSAVNSLPGVDLANRITSQFTDSEVGELVRRGQITDPDTAVKLMQSARPDTPQDMNDAMSNAQPDTQALERPATQHPSDFLTQRDYTISQAQSNLGDRWAEYDKALKTQAQGLSSSDPELETARGNYIAKSNAAINSIARINNEAQAAYDDAIAKYDSAVKDADDFVKNKKSYWESKSDGQKAMAIIAMAIGGFVEGYSMGKIRNGAADIIENKINQYIKEQELQYDKLKDKQAAAQTLYGMLRNKYGDKMIAQKAMLDIGLDQTAKMVDTLGASAKKKETVDALQAQIAEKRKTLAEDVLKSAQSQTMLPSDVTKMGNDVRTTPPQNEKEREGFISGFGTARNAKAADDLINGYIAPTETAVEVGGRLIDMMESPNGLANLTDYTRSGQAEADVLALRGALKPIILAESGKMSDSDRELLTNALKNTTELKNFLSGENYNIGLMKRLIGTQIDATEKQMKYRSYVPGSLRLSTELENAKKRFNPNSATSDKYSKYGKKGTVRPGY